MTIAYPLRLFLDCSTAHLSSQARIYVDRTDVVASPTPYGWFVWASEEPGDDVPPDLIAIMSYARSLGAEYICFDCDADEIDGFPTFDWG